MPDLSHGVQAAWQIAAAEVVKLRHERLEPLYFIVGICSIEKLLSAEAQEHLQIAPSVAATLRSEWSALSPLFTKIGSSPATLRKDARSALGRGNYAGDETRKISRSEASRAAFSRAAELAEKSGASAINLAHLFAGLLDDGSGAVATFLAQRGVDVSALAAAARAITLPTVPSDGLLERFGIDLTAKARQGELNQCIGRRNELLQLVRTLSRETKNNPLLIGEPGVGKTAIVEGLAWRIAQGKSLPGKRIVQVQIADLVAGAKYRGEFEERLQALVREIAKATDVILFLDEIHTLIGAGDRPGGLDAANILKPALARGELRCIGATTLAEFRKYIEKDAALERRFQPVTVNEPSVDEAVEILRGLYRDRFAKRHNVEIDAAALQAAVQLSARYLPDRRLPDKAIDLLGESCARVAVPRLTALPGDTTGGGLVTVDTVAQVLSEWTHIPIGNIKEGERERLMRLAVELRARVIGQDDACKKVAQAIQRARAGLKRPGHPIAVFLFVGPTGVGKTELAKATAAFLFGSDKAMVRIDMSEFMEKHTVSRLIGAPPGYVGHEEEGQLTGALRCTPFCVVLLDEIEKAHPDVLNLYVQLFDEGRLTDNKGHTADATNALFIMTSNLGHESGVGFRREESGAPTDALLAEVRKAFRPEFFNRLDDVIVFNPLAAHHIQQIARLMLNDLETRLQAQGIGLEVTDAAVEWLCKQGFDEAYGARPLRRVIEQNLENQIAGKLLREEARPGHVIVVDLKVNALAFELRGKDTE
jgi:ATP-dependent Clp protease ATP-binding subunit ClpC